ncbi:hypothetical protein NP233_g9507 [Leucocoprinus birnbaumii]|uniref:XPG-I domain-containing protein n=1 Tax=Leucocoprinus birnbaumii TaxID=56174 RepID=A0AAD5YQS8_9AGAR|nr:hypothetical protein NP233_g9507 [Leucocoprinus birnbaumii]
MSLASSRFRIGPWRGQFGYVNATNLNDLKCMKRLSTHTPSFPICHFVQECIHAAKKTFQSMRKTVHPSIKDGLSLRPTITDLPTQLVSAAVASLPLWRLPITASINGPILRSSPLCHPPPPGGSISSSLQFGQTCPLLVDRRKSYPGIRYRPFEPPRPRLVLHAVTLSSPEPELAALRDGPLPGGRLALRYVRALFCHWSKSLVQRPVAPAVGVPTSEDAFELNTVFTRSSLAKSMNTCIVVWRWQTFLHLQITRTRFPLTSLAQCSLPSLPPAGSLNLHNFSAFLDRSISLGRNNGLNKLAINHTHPPQWRRATSSDKLTRLEAELSYLLELAKLSINCEHAKKAFAQQSQVVWEKRQALADLERMHPVAFNKTGEAARIPGLCIHPQDPVVSTLQQVLHPKERINAIQDRVEAKLAKHKELDHWADQIGQQPAPGASRLFKYITPPETPSYPLSGDILMVYWLSAMESIIYYSNVLVFNYQSSMGVAGLWSLLKPAAETRSLTELAVAEGFQANPAGLRGYRLGIDISIWLVHAEYGKGGENPVLRTLFFRCATLMKAPFLPLFVFDGPKRPELKRGKHINKSNNKLVHDMKQIVEAFGFDWRMAPGEAEAELAYLNEIGTIDGILTDDGDSFLFGARTVIRNQSHGLSGNRAHPALNAEGRDDKNHTHVFQSNNLQAHPDIQLSRGGLILISLMSGGDYGDGLAGCGIKTAHAIAQCGFGDTLVNAARNLTRLQLTEFLKDWRKRLCLELRTNSQGLLKQRAPSLSSSIPDTFPNIDLLLSYVSPITSGSIGHEGTNPPVTWLKEPNAARLAAACELFFEWGYREAILERFRTVIWPGVVLRVLRRMVLCQDANAKECSTSPCIIGRYFTSNNAHAAPSDSHQHYPSNTPLIVDISRERHHTSTDGLPEYRLEIAPSQLVEIAASGVRGLRQSEGVNEWALSNDEGPSVGGDQGGSSALGKGRKSQQELQSRELVTPVSHLRLWAPACMVNPAERMMVREFRDAHEQKSAKKKKRCKEEETAAPRADFKLHMPLFLTNVTRQGSKCTRPTMSDSHLFECLHKYIDSSSKSSTTDIEVSDDLEEEQLALKTEQSTCDTSPELMSSVHAVLRGVSDQTHATYQRLMKQCERILRERNYINDTAEFFSDSPKRLAPYHIVLWIQDACDTVKYNGSGGYVDRPSSEFRLSYTHAMKMRAAATYGFGRVHQLGDVAWYHNPASDSWRGNPSLSALVSTYMVSLRRRKVQAGEAPVSARAITPDLIKKLWNHNIHSPVYGMSQLDFEAHVSKQSKAERLSSGGPWCGPRGLRLLNLVYTLAFTCLLRIDEVLKIQYQDLVPISDTVGASNAAIKLQLPFRKTDQFGEIKPFILHELPKEMKHLCPVRAFARWVDATNTNEGYIFRRIGSGDRLGEGDTPMTQPPTAPIRSAAEAASGCQSIFASRGGTFVSGVGGPQSSLT